MDRNIPFSVVLLAGGKGTRMHSPIPKQYLKLKNQIVALYSFKIFASMPQVEQLIVVCEPEYREVFSSLPFKGRSLLFTQPGLRRQDSLYNALLLLKGDPLVCVHDAARPFIDEELVHQVMNEAKNIGAAVLGVRAKSTIKVCNEAQMVLHTPDRRSVWEIQTPQAAKLSLLNQGFAKAMQLNAAITDEGGLIELIDQPVKVVEGTYLNIKLTTPEDLLIAEQFLCTVIN
ncbi:MAG: 2-C-methyl-D-erythritol 4-phosphate cytidylyltransferase [Candidatus Protochlamydia sp.]|nr:2-C-methyl-D-erythritol 4-phosphate cytidylyltransferase [Candidatus Protochlamydia sp.]